MFLIYKPTKIHNGQTLKYKYVQRFYKDLLIKENRKTILIIVFLSLLKIIVELVPPILMIKVLDYAIPAHKIDYIFYLGLGILLFTLLDSILNYFLNKLYCKFGNHIYTYFQKKCIHHLLEMSGTYYSNTSNGEMCTTLFQDISNIKGFVSKTVFQFISDIILAICMFCFLLYLQWDLLLIMVIVLPSVYFSQKYFQDIQKKKVTKYRESYGRITGLLEDMVSNTMAMLYSKGEHFFAKKYYHHIKEFTQNDLEIELVYAKNDGILKFLSALINIIVLLYGGIKIVTGNLTIGGFMAFNMYSSKLAIPLFEVSAVLIEFQTRKVSLQKVYQFLDFPGLKQKDKREIGIRENCNNISFQQVDFSYKKNHVLKETNLNFSPNSINVVVGESGTGKSTIVSLLYRFWNVQNGVIKINDTNIEEYDIEYLREQITVVSQDMYLFNDTIFNNIALGSAKDNSAVMKAANAACIHDFILSLPAGYDTLIGEKGMKLSGGEKQRICLARAFLRDTPILILDEATSALDSFIEKKIWDNIKKLSCTKTIILITHRLNSITDADCIFVLNNGKCIDKGKHQDLINSNAYYQKLYRKGSYNENKFHTQIT